MVTKKVKIKNRNGMHARPCATIVGLATKYHNANIMVFKEELFSDAKSIMGLMMLAMSYDDEIRIEVDGHDEQFILETIADALTFIYDYQDDE